MMRRLLFLMAVIPFTLGGLYLYHRASLYPGLPSNLMEAMRRAQKFELLTIDPASGPLYGHDPISGDTTQPKDTLRGYTVLGRGTVADSSMRENLLSAFDQAVREENSDIRCFSPRHAIHAEVDGNAIDLLICFECKRYQLFKGAEEGGGEWGCMSRSAQASFKMLAEKLGLPAAPESTE
jgi:hypothetical protein